MSLTVMLVDRDPERGDLLQEALAEVGYRVIARIEDDESLSSEVSKHRPDVIVIDMESPGRDTLEQMRQINRDQPKPIIMFSDARDPGLIREAVRAGVSAYVVDGLSRERIMPIVEVAVERFRELQNLRKELEETKSQLADRKVIEKAKGILMKKHRLDEEAAYRLMRKTAMSRNLKLVDLANILVSLEMDEIKP